MLNEYLARAIVAERTAAAERANTIRRWSRPAEIEVATTRRRWSLRLRVRNQRRAAAQEPG